MISDLVVLIVLSSDLLVVQFMCMPLIRKFCLSSESVEYLFCKWSMMWMQDVSLGGASSDVAVVLLLKNHLTVLHNVTTASSNCCTFVVMLAMEEDVGSRHR